MAHSKTTIRDVAKKAGVSVSTVSKAFNNRERIAPATRQRILQIATELHFAPNALIRSLQRGHTNTAGVYIWEIHEQPSHDIVLPLMKGLQEGLAAAKLDALFFSRMESRGADRMATVVLDGRIDALITGPHDISDQGLQAIAHAEMPVVMLYRRNGPPEMGWVDVDNQAGIAALMHHLHSLGHTRIAFYAPYYTCNYQERAEAWRSASLHHDPDLCFYNPQAGLADIEQVCERMMSLPKPPTALVAGDDAIAFRVIEVMQNRGLRVPDQLSVTGFDDVAAAQVSPGLTTIRQPAIEAGRLAAQFLKGLLQGCPAETCQALLPVSLVVRGSTSRCTTR